MASGKKTILIPFNFRTRNSSKLQKKSHLLLEARQDINQLKLAENLSRQFIIVADNSGVVHLTQFCFNYKLNELKILNSKCFDCKIDHNDNSIWSLDFFYPFLLIGGNHRCVILVNIEEQSTEDSDIRKSLIYLGNKHNVPYVSFSPEGEFISCASIDTHVKIWHTFSKQLLMSIPNKENQW